MDPLRDSGFTSSPETSPEPHGLGSDASRVRRERSPTPGAADESPLPHRARLADTEAGPSLRRPYALQFALLERQSPLPPNPRTDRPASLSQEAGPSWRAPPPHPGSPVSTTDPSQSRQAASEAMRALLVELDVPNDPGPTHFDLLWNRLMEEPELASRFASVFGGMLRHANTEAPERNFDFPFSLNQFIVLRSLLSGLDGLRQMANRVPPATEQSTRPQQHPLGTRPQQHTLATELQIWSGLTGVSIDPADAFDHDENAAPFAHVLASLLIELHQEPETSARTTADVSSMLQAIANDAELRSEVFSLAQDAVGSCSDSLAEGFSRMVLAVDNHRMVEAVKRGEVDAKRLDDWAGSLFRLSLLETAVSRHIASRLRHASSLSAKDRANLQEEPLETMVHAKVALRKSLDLPTSTVSMMQHLQHSVLGHGELESLRREVQLQAQDADARADFLLGHPTWRAGIQALHPQEFQELKSRQDEDPFYDLDLPAATDLAEQAAYAERALQVHNRHALEERALLLRFAAESGHSR